jgi:DNA polymerase/3'-5' exonuclease PolX
VRELEGFGPKSEKKILEAVERLLRRAGGAAH